MPSWASTSASVVLAPRTIPVSFVVATSSPLGPPVRSSGTNGSRRPFASYEAPSPWGMAGVVTRGAVPPAAAGTLGGGATGAGAVAAATGLGAGAAGGGGEPPQAVSVAQRPPRAARAPARLTSGPPS